MLQQSLDLALVSGVGEGGIPDAAFEKAVADLGPALARLNGEAKTLPLLGLPAETADLAPVRAAAERQIEVERQAAQISLRTDIGLLATSLAEQIVGEQLTDPAVSSHVIDRFMDQLEADNVRAAQQGTRQGAR